MAPGHACDAESPGFRRGLFVGVQEAPGGNPGTPGLKTIPPSMPHGAADSTVMGFLARQNGFSRQPDGPFMMEAPPAGRTAPVSDA